jgi:Fe-S-cluster containining protein
MLNQYLCKKCNNGFWGLTEQTYWNDFSVRCKETSSKLADIRQYPPSDCKYVVEQLCTFDECKKHIATYHKAVYDKGEHVDYEFYEVEEEMMSVQVDCSKCQKHCCGMIPNLTPVLTSNEERHFEGYTTGHPTEDIWKIHTLNKKENGNCVFLDETTHKCTVYEKRPLECVIYPYLLDFSSDKPSIKLDTRYCPQCEVAKSVIKKEELEAYVQKQHFPNYWVKAYVSLQNCNG